MDASITGSIDLAGLTFGGPATVQAFVNAGSTRFAIGTPTPSSDTGYSGVSATSGSPFTSAPFDVASSGSGGPFGLANSVLWVPASYTSGAAINASSVFNNTTLAALGLKTGTYNYTWGAGAHADSMTLQIGSPTPEPSSMALIGLGLGALGLVIRRRTA